MSGTAVLDALMANAWPPQVVERRGDWRLRRAGGVSRRANSALAVGGEDQIPELIRDTEGFYRSHGAAPLFQVSTASAPPDLAGLLQRRGYQASARTLVLLAATADVSEVEGPRVEARLAVSDRATDDWFDTYWSVESRRGRTGADAALCRTVLLAPPLETVFLAVREGPDVLGVGQLVIETGFAGVQCMATRPAHRGRGVAAAVLRHLAAMAADRGVEHLYLAVMADNHTARRLYERAGFCTVHEYCYFAA